MKHDDPSNALRQIVQWADAYSGEAFEPLSDEELHRGEALGCSAKRGLAPSPRVDLAGIRREGLAA